MLRLLWILSELLESRLMSAVLTSPRLSSSPSDSALTYDNLARGLSYDPAAQVQQILHQLGASGPTINQAAYTYNGVGNRDSLTDRRGIQNFGYDNLDRLTSATHPLLGTPQAFAYDAVGNRTTAGNVTNAGNQLTADATHSYQYDDNGNLIRKTLLTTGNYTSYTYDPENRLTKVEDFVAGNSTAAFTSTYRYDGLGRRIEKVANGQTKRYIYDGEDILLEYDGANVLQARYTHGPGIDEPIAITKGSSTFFYHQDGLGSVTDLTDSAGATAKSYSYDAYGNILESPGTVEQPYTYTGREFDSESGLYYYRERYYDSVTGRFLQKDPIDPRNEVNFYSYVRNNTPNLIDPMGKNPLLIGLVGGEAFEALAVAGAAVTGVYVAAITAMQHLQAQQGAEKSISETQQKQIERKAYKRRCSESPPGGLDDCDKARWNLERNRDCLRMREEFGRKWYNDREPGHEIVNDSYRRAIQELEKWIKDNCCGQQKK